MKDLGKLPILVLKELSSLSLTIIDMGTGTFEDMGGYPAAYIFFEYRWIFFLFVYKQLFLFLLGGNMCICPVLLATGLLVRHSREAIGGFLLG
jgi:hypothetical protein